jgi:hypothetical protein
MGWRFERYKHFMNYNGTNKRGKILESICDQHNHSIMNGEEPTSRKSSNIIDMVICSDDLIQKINNIYVETSLTESDHWPVSFTLYFKSGKSMVKLIKWDQFKLELNKKYRSNPQPIESISDLELRATAFSKHVLSAVNNNSHTKKIDNFKCTLPKEILDLIKFKKRI